MSDRSSVYRRIVRRETTSPRSTLAITIAAILVLLCIYAGAETLLSMMGQPPLIAGPADMAKSLVDVPAYPAFITIVAGSLVALLGLILIILAIKTGRRSRHVLGSARTATVVDDEVIASALARHASYEGNVDPDNARVSVSRRRAVVNLTATSGKRVDTSPVEDIVGRELASYGLTPPIRSKVSVNERRKVGA